MFKPSVGPSPHIDDNLNNELTEQPYTQDKVAQEQ